MGWKGAINLVLDCSAITGFGALPLTWPLQPCIAYVCGSQPKKTGVDLTKA